MRRVASTRYSSNSTPDNLCRGKDFRIVTTFRTPCCAGQSLLLDDGKLSLEVIDNDGEGIRTRVLHGGALSDRKGVNVPDTLLSIPVLTQKDLLLDLEFALSLGADWIALSFVQRPEDVIDARALDGERAGLMVKLEKPAALEKLDEIVSGADLTHLRLKPIGELTCRYHVTAGDFNAGDREPQHPSTPGHARPCL